MLQEKCKQCIVSRQRRSPSCLFPIDWNSFVMVFHVSIHLHSLPYQRYYSHADRLFGLGAGSMTGAGSDASMKVWLMVLTTIPYSSTSARRQSKKACAACLDAASDRCRQTQTHKHTFRLHACKSYKGCDSAVNCLIPNITEDILDMIVFCGVVGSLHVCKVALWEHVWRLSRLLEFDLKLVQGTKSSRGTDSSCTCAVTRYPSVTGPPPIYDMWMEFCFCCPQLHRAT